MSTDIADHIRDFMKSKEGQALIVDAINQAVMQDLRRLTQTTPSIPPTEQVPSTR